MYNVKIEQFEGPLDLLLDLIGKEKLNINELSLALVTDQYLNYLQNNENTTLDNLADFLSVATKLVLIKSKSLLPLLTLTDEEEEEILDLEYQLQEYKKFKDVSQKIKMLAESTATSFSRQNFLKSSASFCFPEGLMASDIRDAFRGILMEAPVMEKLEQEKVAEVISLKEKIAGLKDSLRQRLEITFSKLTGKNSSKIEVVVSFLAVLEMVKQKIATAEQSEIFSEIKIRGNRIN